MRQVKRNPASWLYSRAHEIDDRRVVRQIVRRIVGSAHVRMWSLGERLFTRTEESAL